MANHIEEVSFRAKDQLNYGKIILIIFIGILISSSWLGFPYLVQGKKILRDVGDNARVIKGETVSQYYSRQLFQHANLEISATFATADFFQYVDNTDAVGRLRPDKYFIFFLTESIHSGSLGSTLPNVELVVDGQHYAPVKSEGPAEAEHHRVSVFSFSKRDAAGTEIDLNNVASIKLAVSDQWLDIPETFTFEGIWQAPFGLPEELEATAGITPVAVLALAAGLLSSVLTPCLLQLVVIFGSIIGGFATVPSQQENSVREVTPVIRRKIMQIAIAFVIGFISLYMVAGAIIGAIGHQAQLMFAEYSRSIAFASGILVILLGIWVGLRGTSHFACKIPNQKFLHSLSIRDNIGSIALSMGYALGCTACFGGAIVATLIVYVGAIGSASIGAGIMLIFSIGVAVPFLLAAYFISRMDSILVFFALKANILSKISMVLIILFGSILVTDNFHTVSDLIYPYLGLN